MMARKIGMLIAMALVFVAVTVQASDYLLDVNGNKTIYASGLWHFDGNMDEELGTGSTSTPWWDYDWAGASGTHSGSSALDLTDTVHGMQKIMLAGDARINGSTGFGIAMWVKRTGIYTDYNSLLGFGSDSLFQIYNHDWYPSLGWYLLRNSNIGSVPKGGNENTFMHTPLNTWSFVAVFAYTSGGQNYLGVYSADADHGQTCYTTVAVPAGGSLNGSDDLWLGGIAGDTRNSLAYIDELVIANQACNVNWAQSIYLATKDGQALAVPEPISMLLLLAGGVFCCRKRNA